MPNVKLLKAVAEGGRDLEKAMAAADAFGLGKNDPKYPRLKVIRKRNPNWFPPQMVDGKVVECPEPPIVVLPFIAGTVVTMNDDGVAKWAAQGLCQVTDEAQSAYVAP